MSTLERRFSNFLKMLPSVESIDDIPKDSYDSSKQIADYFGFDRKLIIEQKTIHADQAEKVQAIVEAYEDEEFYPQFYGTRDLDSVLEKFPNGPEVKQKIYVQMTKLLEGYLSEAKRQIRSTSELFNVDNPSGLLIIINDRVKILSPEVVVTRIRQRLGEKTSAGGWRYAEIPFVLYVCETHLLDGAVPSVFLVEGPKAQMYKAHREYIDYVVTSWSYLSSGDLLHVPPSEDFSRFKEKEDPEPGRVTQSDGRAAWYNKNPYMRAWADDRVLSSASAHLEDIAPYLLKDGPILPMNELAERTLLLTDFIQEFNFRGLDLRQLRKLTSSE